MGRLENIYAEREAAEKREKDEKRLHEKQNNAAIYNQSVEGIKRIAQKIIERSEIQIPDKFEWFTVNGEKYVGWEVYQYGDYYDGYQYIYLLSNGEFVHPSGNSAIYYLEYKYECDKNLIKRNSDHIINDFSIKDFYASILLVARRDFGVKF